MIAPDFDRIKYGKVTIAHEQDHLTCLFLTATMYGHFMTRCISDYLTIYR